MRGLPILLLSLALSVFVECQDKIPDVSLTPDMLSVNEGEEANFTCSPLLEEAPALLNTRNPGASQSQSIQNDDSRIRVTDISNNDTGNVTRMRVFTWINPILENDHRREFFCQIGSFESNTAILFVNHAPDITIGGETEFTVIAGATLNVSITVDGWPEPWLTWTRDGARVDLTLSKSGLSLPSVSLDDAGIYTLNATNAMSSDTGSFTVIVRSPPVFEVGDDARMSIRVGAEVVVNCAANAFPPISPDNITLTLDGEELELDSNFVHTIASAETSDAGDYVCTATNELATESVTITVEIGNVPDKVSDIVVAEDNERVMVKWVAGNDNGARILNYTVEAQYREETIMRSVTETTLVLTREELGVSEDGDTFQLTVTIRAVNGIGSSEPASDTSTVTFTNTRRPTAETGAGSPAHAMRPVPTILVLVVCSAVLFL